MLKKFISGLVSGLGFAISLVIVLSIWINYMLPFSFMSEPINIKPSSSTSIPFEDKHPFIENFSDLPLEQQIAHSTAIIVTKIQKNASGIYESRVTEILKKQDDVDMYYKVGDVYDDYSDYNQEERDGGFIPKGFIIFMSGSPASMIYSVSYSGDRIGSLGGISIELLREKCSS